MSMEGTHVQIFDITLSFSYFTHYPYLVYFVFMSLFLVALSLCVQHGTEDPEARAPVDTFRY
jgi:hypothetical protein